MLYISHRINTLSELLVTPSHYGVEIDLRDYQDDIILTHDPFEPGEYFTNFLEHYHHAFLILNIKSERIEHRVLKLLQTYQIINYFFLDSSFPMIYQLTQQGERRIALRYSEYEGLENILLMSNKIEWVWVDCFTSFPLTTVKYQLLKNQGLKICIVSPELQQQPGKLIEYAQYMHTHNIIPDMICTKYYNIPTWQKIFNL